MKYYVTGIIKFLCTSIKTINQHEEKRETEKEEWGRGGEIERNRDKERKIILPVTAPPTAIAAPPTMPRPRPKFQNYYQLNVWYYRKISLLPSILYMI